jgi:transposase, IS30 family
LPDTAQEKMQIRRQESKERFKSVSKATIEHLKKRQYHSPEQIAGRMKQERLDSVSYETIYQMIYADHAGLEIHK